MVWFIHLQVINAYIVTYPLIFPLLPYMARVVGAIVTTIVELRSRNIFFLRPKPYDFKS